MQTKRRLTGLIARVLIVITTSATMTPGAHAATIGTEGAVGPDRERILMLIDRPDVTAQLEAYGVKAADAKARVAALTDREVAQLAADIDNAPAGGFIQVIAVALVAVAYVVAAAVMLVAMAVRGVITMIARADDATVKDAVPAAANEPGSVAATAESGAGSITVAPLPISSSTTTTSLPAAGDSWTYRLTEPKRWNRQGRIHQVTIASVTPEWISEHLQGDTVMQRTHRKGGYLVREGDLSLFSPYLVSYEVPVLGTRIADIQNLPDTCGAAWICSISGTVIAKELVRVPAGAFEAIKIEVQHTWTARYPNAESGARTLTIWYSPLTKRAVKFSSRGSSRSSIHSDFDLELESYSLN